MSYLIYNGKRVVSTAGKYVGKTIITPPLVLKDLDGNQYETVTIGSQIWITKNLQVTKYSDGTPVIAESQYLLQYNTDGGYVWYNDNIANKDPYGALYNFAAVSNPSDLCYFTDLSDVPQPGWRIATQNDVSTLIYTLGGMSVAGGKMKETGTTHWTSPNTGATNESGFTFVGSGFLTHTGNWYYINQTGYLQTSTVKDGDPTSAWGFEVGSYDAGIYSFAYAVKSGFPTRCVKDLV